MRSTAQVYGIAALTFLTLTACGPNVPQDKQTPRAQDTAPEVDLANATYAGVYDEPVELTEGRYQGEPFQAGAASRPTLVLLPNLVTHGDLDGDGRDEGIGILVENSGGSGSFVYLAVVAATASADRNLDTILLGDRANITSLAVEEGAIEVTLIEPSPEGPMSGTGQERTRRFVLETSTLAETASGSPPTGAR